MKSYSELNLVNGISTIEAKRRFLIYGPNEIPQQKRQNVLSLLWKVISEPMLLLLIASGLIYLFLGEPKDAVMLSSFVIVVVGITFYQEKKTEKTLDALRQLSSPKALVIRDGERIKILGREVVVGDLLILSEGDRVPADTIVISCENMAVDESMLTGESIPVRKIGWDGKKKNTEPGGDDLPFVYSGSLIVSGHGVAQVSAIGADSEIGKIGKSIASIEEEDTLLHKETSHVVKIFGAGGIILCLVVIVISFLTKGNILEAFLSGLTLSMAMLPEEFPVVLTIFLTLGAWRISKSKVLTRRPSAIETLGAATVLCVDKTGTLTQNRSELKTLWVENSTFEFTEKSDQKLDTKFNELLEYSALASQVEPYDPLEKEIREKAHQYLVNTTHLNQKWKLVKEYPLTKNLIALSHVWQSKENSNLIVASKGSPEAIINLCHLNQNQKAKIEIMIQAMALKGLRILGVAKTEINTQQLPEEQCDFKFEFVGLIGFVDPVRSTIKDSVKEAYRAGVRIIMITGDYPGTAVFVANRIGLNNPNIYLTGADLAKMSGKQLQEKIKTVNIFARVVPEQKLNIVNALKRNKEIVAMTGDGVNDAPALKAAHIGIAMGERGSDVAREAASLVLLNDDFSSIVEAIKLGRRIFTNLKKAMGYILAVHIPIAGISLLPVLFKLPPILLPAHIAFLELIIDPACSTVFESEPEESDVMKRPPRNLKERIFDKKVIIGSVLQGGIVLLLVSTLYFVSTYLGRPEVETRTLTFSALVILNIVLITTNLSFKEGFFHLLSMHNKPYKLITLGALTALALVVYVPFLSSLFSVSSMRIESVVILFSTAIFALVTFEFIKK